LGGALLGVWLLLSSALAQADQVTDKARALLDAKRAKEAYDLLRPLEAQRAGEIEFDYLLGISALDAGDAQGAVFALERVLAVNPNYLQARAEIARAYFVLGEKENARREFETVRQQGIPSEARFTIDKFLSALEPQTTQWRAYLEAALGYDTNVNSATGRGSIAIPAFGGAVGELSATARQQGSGFWGLGAGGSVNHALSDEWALLGALAAASKWNFSYTDFDTAQFDGSLGARWTSGPDSIIALAQGQNFKVGGDNFRNSVGGTVQWLHNFSQSQQFTLFGQFAALRYPDQQPRNANRYIGGIAYSQAFTARYSPVLFASAYGGSEQETDSAYPWLGNTPLGLRVGGQLSLAEYAVLYSFLSYENRRYGGQDPLFLTTRTDNQFDARLGLAYTVVPKWVLTPQVAYTNNGSNIELYQYNRTVAGVTVRRDF
jgi:tetratricopeptide (TPR) repeat protein